MLFYEKKNDRGRMRHDPFPAAGYPSRCHCRHRRRGKTLSCGPLGEELAGQHPVLLCTTTKILPFSDLPCARTAAELDELRRAHQLLCAGTDEPGTGKLTAPETPMAVLAEQFDYILVEADGAARRPLKAHAPPRAGDPN